MAGVRPRSEDAYERCEGGADSVGVSAISACQRRTRRSEANGEAVVVRMCVISCEMILLLTKNSNLNLRVIRAHQRGRVLELAVPLFSPNTHIQPYHGHDCACLTPGPGADWGVIRDLPTLA